MTVKTYGEQLAALQETRNEKNQLMSSLMAKAMDEGRSLNTAEAAEFDTAEAQVKHIDADMARLRKLEAINSLTNVKTGETVAVEKGVNGVNFATVKNTQKLEPGVAFARAAKCLALGHLENRSALDIAKSLYSDNDAIVATTHRLLTKAAVPAATTTDSTWASPLVDTGAPIADFIEYLRPRTILGRFGQNGVPSLRNVGFRLPIVGQTSGGDGYWVGETNAKPVTKFDFTKTSLEPLKVANIAVASMEVIRDSRPAADLIIRDQLAAAISERLDIDFIDPNKTAVANVSPASILNGAASVPSSGNDATAIREDVRSLFGTFIAANNAPTSGVWLMDSVSALALSMMQNPLGQSEFPGIGMNGGTFFGLPVIVSQYSPRTSAGGVVALINADDIYVGDEGGIDLSMSTEASLQMDNSPDNPTTASTVLVSLWQRNLVGFRAERTINWARRRASSVAYLTGVNWGA